MNRYSVTELCALAGMSRQAFCKRDEDALLRRLALERFVVQFVREALRMAIATLPDSFCGTLIHHSDRGIQYVCADYIRELTDNRITPSMTEDGNPKDNAVAERINSTMKNELLYGKIFTDIGQVAEAVGDAVAFYNGE